MRFYAVGLAIYAVGSPDVIATVHVSETLPMAAALTLARLFASAPELFEYFQQEHQSRHLRPSVPVTGEMPAVSAGEPQK